MKEDLWDSRLETLLAAARIALVMTLKRPRFRLSQLLMLSAALMGWVHALPKDKSGPGKIEGTANEEPVDVVDADKAILATIKYPEGMEASVFAREPDVLNATAISMDEQNRLFIAETHRFDRGIEDNRRNWYWLRDEVGLKTTADRLALYEKWADKKEPGYYTKYAEKIRVLEDKDGDGKAEKSWLYADGFNDPLDGTAAGIMAANGKVYFACIPHVWMLEDKNGDGVSDVRTSLQEGYGISVSLSGHDLNGFAFGPDGRIYFTIGDRGYDLKTADGRHLYDQYGGAIFRMEPDGSGLEVVHYSLRNPKEIAFDQYGVAFSVDNNADMGDKARVVHMVEGAVSGWNRGNQNFRNFPHAIDVTRRHETPWMSELWWEIEAQNRPAAFLPPSGHLSVGPSGLAYNPGTGLKAHWDNNFFVCDYRGGGSEVIAFEMQPKGAGYEVARDESFISGFLNTDIEFGYDGKVYVSDFTGGWKTYEFGTVFVFHDPKETAKPVVKEVKGLFAEGFDKRPAEELAALLSHQDLRVRQRAQFALAESVDNRGRFIAATAADQPLVTRLHGLWGLAQLSRLKKDPASGEALVKLAGDSNWRVRGQAAQALGDSKFQGGRDVLIGLLEDANLNNRMLASIALGKLGHREDVQHLIEVLAGNTNRDTYLRHGAVHGLRLIAEANGSAEDLLKFKSHDSSEVRLGLIIALRRLREPGIAHFLKDEDPALVVETIQAINDGYIEGDAREALAAATDLVGKFGVTLDYRIINSIVRLGKQEGVVDLLKLAENPELPEDTRVECLFQLRRWEEPPAGDPTTGKIRPIEGERGSLEKLKPQIESALRRLLDEAKGHVLAEVLVTGEKFDVAPSMETLKAQFLDDDNLTAVRLAALKNLRKESGSALVAILRKAIAAKDPDVRKASLEALAAEAPEVAM
ncbi:MAG: PVC-type heme-binding CxxCH protein, partial [Haloferula sp.]